MATNNAINTGLPIEVANGGTGASSITANGVVIGAGTSAVTASTLTDGQLLIGSTGNAPATATLTAGTHVTINNSAGGIEIVADDQGVAYQAITASQSAANGEGYIIDGAGTLTVTLPTDGSSSIGDQFGVTYGSQGWIIDQNSGDTIRLGSSSTTTTSGTLASTAVGDSVVLVKVAANTWQAVSVIGNITVS